MANPNEKPTGKYSATESYLNSTHRIGRISGVIAIILIMMVPAVITFVNRDIPVDLSKTFSAIVTLTAIYGVVSVVEVVSFSPYLGTGGTYLSFITGNIMNMKLPAAMNALRVNKLTATATRPRSSPPWPSAPPPLSPRWCCFSECSFWATCLCRSSPVRPWHLPSTTSPLP